MDALPKAWLADEEVEDLRELIRYRCRLVYLRTRAKNNINSALVRCGLLRPYIDIFGIRGRKWFCELKLSEVIRLQVDNWLGFDRRFMIIEYSRLSRDCGGLCAHECWSEDVKLLMTMPGWGRMTALVVLAELGDYRRFKSRSSVRCFAGLIPVIKRSDKSSRYGHISKRGSTQLRSILVEVTINAVRRVNRYGALYSRLKRERGGCVAKTAVARQMLEDGWTMLIEREPFRHVEQVETVMRAG